MSGPPDIQAIIDAAPRGLEEIEATLQLYDQFRLLNGLGWLCTEEQRAAFTKRTMRERAQTVYEALTDYDKKKGGTNTMNNQPMGPNNQMQLPGAQGYGQQGMGGGMGPAMGMPQQTSMGGGMVGNAPVMGGLGAPQGAMGMAPQGMGVAMSGLGAPIGSSAPMPQPAQGTSASEDLHAVCTIVETLVTAVDALTKKLNAVSNLTSANLLATVIGLERLYGSNGANADRQGVVQFLADTIKSGTGKAVGDSLIAAFPTQPQQQKKA
jgi:hypothetical protein